MAVAETIATVSTRDPDGRPSVHTGLPDEVKNLTRDIDELHTKAQNERINAKMHYQRKWTWANTMAPIAATLVAVGAGVGTVIGYFLDNAPLGATIGVVIGLVGSGIAAAVGSFDPQEKAIQWEKRCAEYEDIEDRTCSLKRRMTERDPDIDSIRQDLATLRANFKNARRTFPKPAPSKKQASG